MKILLWVFAVIGILFVLVFASLIGVGVVGAKKGLALIEGAEDYVNETIAVYGGAWDEQVLLDRAAPEMNAELARNPGAIDQLSMVMDTEAGAFVSAAPAVCANFTFAATTAEGEVFTAQCVSQGVVENGAIEFKAAVVHRQDVWRLLGFSADVTLAEPSATQVAYRPSQPVGIAAAIGGRSIVISPLARTISYHVTRDSPVFVGVHAEASAAAER